MDDISKLLRELSRDNLVKVSRSDDVYKNMKNQKLIANYYNSEYKKIFQRNSIEGSSPTEIFIGRFGYPKVSIGPLVSPFSKSSELLGNPALWKNLSIDKIVKLRFQLIRGMHTVGINDVEKSKIAESIRDLALSDKSAYSDLDYTEKPIRNMSMERFAAPFGPTLKFNKFQTFNSTSNKQLEKLYSDVDAKASTAITELYENKVDIYKIQKGISAGLFGLKNKRKFVPTRWSITMVDSTISKSKLQKIREYDKIDHPLVFFSNLLDTRWVILMFPCNWEYEVIEAWYPKSSWNTDPNKISIESSYESYRGRSTYAEITGSYYAARLMVADFLDKIKKQAQVIILREVHEGYNLPVGVWNVREHVKQTLESKEINLDELSDIFRFINSKLDLNLNEWIKNSKILTDKIKQRKLF